MQESYGEGPASHTGPESCAAVREGRGEALTGERAGRPSSREMHAPSRKRRVLQGADAVEVSGRPHSTCREGEARRDPARSETPSTYGSTSHGNREIPRPPVSKAGRIGKSKDVRR